MAWIFVSLLHFSHILDGSLNQQIDDDDDDD